jgi:hypothetical protein
MEQNYLVIYDTSGRVISQMAGSITEPKGIPFMWVEVHNGQYVERIDVTATPHRAILSEPPRDLVAEKLTEIEKRLSNTEGDNIMVLAAMAEVYEAVLPFLPPQD